MALEEYRRKRDFSKTPEPAGRAHKKRGRGLQFIVQKHAARRLHYDFRLELDGVMKSWAVPKGPSLDPKEKRLAVQTEDHPMEYNTFEGVIPEGEYGGGTVLLWDRGTWTPLDENPSEAFRKGSLKFALEGEKLHGNWALVRMGGRAARESRENWLLVKERDDIAVPGSGSALVDENPLSVDTGRDIDEIAAERDRVWRSNRNDEAGGEEKPRKPVKAATAESGRLKGARKATLPDMPEAQLATLAKVAPDGDDWLHEIKFDGYRILARVERGKVRLFSRNGLDWTERFPEIARALGLLPVTSAIIDGEAVALDEQGMSSFGGLQQALSEGKTKDLVYYAFDVPFLDGYDLSEVPLEARKTALAGLVGGAPKALVRYSDHQVGRGGAFQGSACDAGLEGIVSKRRDAPYRPGRSRLWLKSKCDTRDEFVVVGWTDPGGSRVGFGSLVLGYYDRAGALRYCGRVGTGFDDKFLSGFKRKLTQSPAVKKPFRKLPVGAARGVHWVEPRYVAEVRFAGWTRDGVLRHPAFLGLREDKSPEEVVLDGPGGTPAAADPPDPPSAAAPRVTRGGAAEVGGVTVTNANKVLYPGQGITKLDLATYYQAVEEQALRYLAHRPLTLVRCPEGQGGACFFQKHVGSGIPEAVRKVEVREREGGNATYLVVEDLAGLVSLVQMGVLEIHPWGATVDDVERPDQLIFDLDPDEGLGWDRIVEAAFDLKRLFDELGLVTFPKTTGGKGLHVVLPIKPELEWDPAKAFCKAIADAFAASQPDRYTAVMAKRARRGRLFIDYLRNGRGNTAVGTFSTRARPGAPVAAPLSWAEVEEGVRSDAFNIRNMPERLAGLKRDPWRDFFKLRQSIRPVLKRLEL